MAPLEAPSLGEEGVSVSECGLVAGHGGEHIAEDQCAELRALDGLRALSRSFRSVADRLAWGLLTLRAGAGVTTPDELAGELRTLTRELGLVAAAVEAPGRAAAISEGR